MISFVIPNCDSQSAVSWNNKVWVYRFDEVGTPWHISFVDDCYISYMSDVSRPQKLKHLSVFSIRIVQKTLEHNCFQWWLLYRQFWCFKASKVNEIHFSFLGIAITTSNPEMLIIRQRRLFSISIYIYIYIYRLAPHYFITYALMLPCLLTSLVLEVEVLNVYSYITILC